MVLQQTLQTLILSSHYKFWCVNHTSGDHRISQLCHVEGEISDGFTVLFSCATVRAWHH